MLTWRLIYLLVVKDRAIGIDIEPHASTSELRDEINTLFLRLYLAKHHADDDDDTNANGVWLALGYHDLQHQLNKHQCPQQTRKMITCDEPPLDPALSVRDALRFTEAEVEGPPWVVVHLHMLQLTRATTFVDLWTVKSTVEHEKAIHF